MADSFIINNEELALELDMKLEGLPFRTKETFVQMYNSGLINRKNEQVAALVDELIAAYKGIEKRTDGITFLDMGEISADELVAKAEAYSLLLRLQRVAKKAATEGRLTDGDMIYVGKGNVAYTTGKQLEDGTQGKDQPLSSEKLPKISAEASVEAAKLLHVEEGALTQGFEANRILNVSNQGVIAALSALS